MRKKCRALGLVVVGIGACATEIAATGGETTAGGSTQSDVVSAEDGTPVPIDHGTPDVPVTPVCDEDDPCLLDILVVIDNSDSIRDAQRAAVLGLVHLVEQLQATPAVDVHMMFTTTDVDAPPCEAYAHAGYVPAMGAPTTTGCAMRLQDFTPLGFSGDVREDLCTRTCPVNLAPADPFVAFRGLDEGNVAAIPGGAELDIDDDGVPDSAVARTVGCLAPQGIAGCGYEAPLEAMRRALAEDAPWNLGARPFLRPGSQLAIVLVADELDCSADDPSVFDEQQYSPSGPTSALCWNVGVACREPEADGVYTGCQATPDPLTPLSGYVDRLTELRDLEGHDVGMVAITGVPTVTARNVDAPYEPVAGGLADLVVHDAREGTYPDGDVLPGEYETAADLQAEYGVGAGGLFADPAFLHQARGIPNPRVNEVCAALDIDGDEGARVRCCIESVCDPVAALDCVFGWAEQAVAGGE